MRENEHSSTQRKLKRMEEVRKEERRTDST